MRNDRQKAIKLRLSGRSYLEIQRILGIPKSTLSGWFSGMVLSQKACEKIERRGRKKAIEGLLKRNKNQTALAIARATKIRRDAAKELTSITSRELMILGAALYWAEGYKRLLVRNGRELTHHPISLTNSDSFLVKAFLKFLREYLGVPDKKIKASIRIFQHQNEQTLLKYWQKETKILPENFKKSYYGVSKSSLHKRPFHRLPYGTIQIVVADTKLFHRIMGHIEGIKKLV